MLIVMCVIRKLLECALEPHELQALDDLLPNSDDEGRRTSRENSLETSQKNDPNTNSFVTGNKLVRFKTIISLQKIITVLDPKITRT